MISVMQVATADKNAEAGTRDWLEASKRMMIVSYVGPGTTVSSTEQEEDEPAFGTHLKETVDALKYFFGGTKT